MVKSCSVPFCNELYKSKFGIPKDNSLIIVWEILINLKLNPSSRVCEKHFDKNDVIRTWESGKGFSKYTVLYYYNIFKIPIIFLKMYST